MFIELAEVPEPKGTHLCVAGVNSARDLEGSHDIACSLGGHRC